MLQSSGFQILNFGLLLLRVHWRSFSEPTLILSGHGWYHSQKQRIFQMYVSCNASVVAKSLPSLCW